MIKIIGGTYRSRVIKTPEEGTLPTKNMVRGAMVSSLGERIKNARVLDLFAGSGALGIEALSHGASSCLFVDKNPKAAAIVKENLTSLKESKGEVWALDYTSALSKIKEEGRVFDVIFVDPPYALKESYQIAVDYLLENSLCSEDACFILEYEGDIPFECALPFKREYKYGKTKVLALRGSL